MKETDKKLKEGMARKGREAISNVRESKPDQETKEDRAEEYLKTYGMEDDVIKELTWGDDLTMTKLMTDFHTQELKRALPSDQEKNDHASGYLMIHPKPNEDVKIAYKEGWKHCQQQILKNIE